MSYPGTGRGEASVTTVPATTTTVSTYPAATTTTVSTYPAASSNIQRPGASRCSLLWLHISNVVIFINMLSWAFFAQSAEEKYDTYCANEYGSSCSNYSNCEDDEYCSLYDQYGDEVWWYSWCYSWSSSYDYECKADGSYKSLAIALFVFMGVGSFLEFIRLVAAMNLCSQRNLTNGGCDCCSSIQRNATLSMIGDSIFFRFLHCNSNIYGLSMERYDRGEFFVFGNWWWITNFLTCTIPVFICGVVLFAKGGNNGVSFLVALALFIISMIIKMRYRGQYNVLYASNVNVVGGTSDPRAVTVVPSAMGVPVQNVQYGQPVTQYQVQPQPVMMVQMPDGTLAPANPNISYVQAQPQTQPVMMVQMPDGTLSPANPNVSYVQAQPQTYVQPVPQSYAQTEEQLYPVLDQPLQSSVQPAEEAPPAYGLVVHETGGGGGVPSEGR